MEPLKDQFFNPQYISTLSNDIRSVYPKFDAKKFSRLVFVPDWKNKELKQRMRHISTSMQNVLQCDFHRSIDILSRVATLKIKEKRVGFGDMIFPDFVEQYGSDDFETSMKALELFTQVCSSEFAIRPFIIRYPQQTMKLMFGWTKHKNHHVRRLASEGCRSRLPWAMALPDFKKDPSLILPILENLKNDDSEYVRRSVANNLNDISKDHPTLVLDIAKKWYGKNENVNAILKHALRTELKKGNPNALRIFGFGTKHSADIALLRIEPKQIRIGENVRFNFFVRAKKEEKLRIEYWVHFVKSNGSTSKKVFQIIETEFQKGSSKEFSRKHNFKDLTTRKHYPGKHKVSIVINGTEKAFSTIELKK